MLKLKTYEVTPPGGYRDICKETSFSFVADDMAQLVEKERQHLLANKYPVPADLAAQIENRLCHRMPAGICESTDHENYVAGKIHNSTAALLNATQVATRGNRTSQKVADKRVALCYLCENNIVKGGCGTCKGTNNALKEMLNGRFTSYDSKVSVCTALGVYIKVLVHAATPQISTTDLAATAKTCWLRKGKQEEE